MNSAKKVAILTNNIICEVICRYYSTLEKYFILNGWEVTTDFNCDLVIFPACGVMDEMHRAVNIALEQLEQINFPKNNIIITGCQPKTHEAELAATFKGKIIEYGKEYMLDEIINAHIPFAHIKPTNVFKAFVGIQNKGRSELFNIQISDGCLQCCTFCVINKAHGYIRSFAMEDILEQYRSAVEHGYKKIYLFGMDTFAYGYDTGKTNIIELIERMLDISSNENIFLGPLHIKWLREYSDGVLSLCKRGIVNSLHIGLQHVNDQILKRMGRPMKFAELYEDIKRIKSECPNIFLSADLLAGFPGETDEIYQELMSFVKTDTFFDMLQLHVYDDVKAAPAYKLDGKVSPAKKKVREYELNVAIGERGPYPTIKKRAEISDNNEYFRYSNGYQNRVYEGYYFCKNTYNEL